MEYYSAIKRNEVQLHGTTWMNLEHIMLRGKKNNRLDMAHIIWFCLYEMSRIGKTIETESQLVLARGWREREIGTVC